MNFPVIIAIVSGLALGIVSVLLAFSSVSFSKGRPTNNKR